MAIVVAEYLGQRTDTGIVIQPHIIRKNQGSASKPRLQCPFKNSHCEKAARGDKPVCTIRDSETQEIWIVCPSRLCATMKGPANNNLPLNEHQKQILHEIAKEVFDSNIERQDVLVDREVPIRITTTSDYSADYVMWRRNPLLSRIGSEDRPMVLEMQGGGETTSTGDLTQHITNWEEGLVELNTPVAKTAPLVTNAWRRQQEQFLVKGNASMLTGGRIAFCIGSMIYNYLMPRLQSTTIFPQLRHSNWSLALLVIVEDKSESPAPRPACAPDSLPLVIDKSLTLFTSYSFFIQAITNQGSAYPPMFDRNYITLE